MAVFISGVMIILMAIILPIEDIASATDAMFLLLFIFVNLAVVNLRKNRPDLDRGFKVPFFPYIPILATVLNLILAVFLFFYRPLGVWVCLGYLTFGIGFYYLYSRRKDVVALCGPDPRDLVRHDRHPDPCPADQDAPFCLPARHGLCYPQCDVRIVDRIVCEHAVVLDLHRHDLLLI